ncbi:hypothetical protein HDR69_01630 [bacterium]|nr:hypothetical protein [bacterium]
MQKYFYAFSVALALAGGVASRAAMQSDVRSVTPMERDYSSLTPVKGEQYLGRINFNAKDRTTVPSVSTVSIGMAPEVSPVTLGGALHFSTAWTDYPGYGLYSFSTAPDGADTVDLISEYWFFESGNAVVAEDMMYAVDYSEYDGELYVNYNKVDLTTGEYVDYGSFDDLSFLPFDADYDPLTGGVVGCFQNAQGDLELVIADYDTRYRKVICDLPDMLYAVAVDGEGVIYGIDGNGILRSYPRSGGEPVEIMSTGLYPRYMQSATFDYDNDTLYWAFTDGNTSALYRIDPQSKSISKVFDFKNREEFTNLYVKRPAETKAPAACLDLMVSLDADGKGNASFSLPTSDRTGNAISGNLSYTLYADGEILAEGNGQAGAKITLDLTAPTGDVLFRLVTENENGKSYSTKVRQWVGDGYPEAIGVVNYTLEGNTVTLSWEAPANGVLGGYIDPDALTYTVTRYPDGKVVADGISETSFTETLVNEEPVVIWYGVTATYAGNTGEVTECEKFVVGDSFTTPYYEDFENPDNFLLFTILDNNHDGRIWMYAYHMGFHETASAFCNTNKYGLEDVEFSDDWLLTPKICLSADDIYEFGFKSWQFYESGEHLEVAFGQGEDPTDSNAYSMLIPDTRITSLYENAQEFTRDIIPGADGEYRFAFHGISGLTASVVHIDDISVRSVGKAKAPGKVTDLQLVPGADGVSEATVSFRLPVRNAKGDADIKSISKVELRRGGEVLKEWTGVTPGEFLSFNDKNVPAGMNEYAIICHSVEGVGAKAVGSVFVGKDVPAAPVMFKAVDNGNEIVLEWENPGKIGDNGGYVDDTKLTYEVYEVENGKASPIASDLSDTRYVVRGSNTGDQVRMTYGVSAMYDSKLGGIAVSNDVILGEGHDLPFVETFNYAKYDNSGWTQEGDLEHIFYTDSETSLDEGSASVRWAPALGYRDTRLSTGKILPGKESDNLRMIFSRKTTADCDVILNLYVNVDGWRHELVKSFDMGAESDKENWKQEVVDLTPYNDAVSLSFDFVAHGEALGESIWLDRIQVRNVLEKDLIVSLDAKKNYTAGKSGQVLIRIDNNSTTPASDYTVNLYADDNLIASTPGQEIPGLNSTVIEMELTPDAITEESMLLKAEVVYEGDMAPSNNLEAWEVNIIPASLPAPQSVVARQDLSGMTLSWAAPEVVEDEVVEDFESYDNGDLVFGDWKTYDLDKGLACGINGVDMPHAQEPFAFMVFNPSESGIDVSVRDVFAPIADEQYLMCMVGYYSSAPHSDDWLISPELSGDAQTIYMFMRKDNEYYDETFEIYYSTTDDDIDSFILLEAGSIGVPEWSEYGFDLPEGAKYFAFRYNATDQFFIFIDDITYRPVVPELTGYRIYRDGKLFTSVDKDCTSIFVEGRDADVSDYVVTAKYRQGESKPSNHAGNSGIGLVWSDDRYVSGGHGEILIKTTAAEKVTVYSVDGKTISSFIADDAEQSINVEKGNYIVRLGDDTVKVIVR